jgi:hypothetical protein
MAMGINKSRDKGLSSKIIDLDLSREPFDSLITRDGNNPSIFT